jgi:D-3-phosphoglycerate dehydrogenase
MKIESAIAIGDLYIATDIMRKAIELLQPAQLTTIDWKAADEAELQARLLLIEKHGVEAVEPPPEIWNYLDNADFLMTHLCPVTRKMIEAAPKLKYLGVCRGGTDSIDQKAVAQRQIKLFNAPGRNANAVAEMTIGLMLAECRNIGRAHASLSTGGWCKKFSNDGKPGELRGKTIGLVGFGMIARKVADLLKAFGTNIIFYDPFVDGTEIQHDGARSVDFDELLEKSDFITLHARRSTSEKPLLGKGEFARMKKSAYVINTARASLIDETALCEALDNKQIAGAALDVYAQEPLPEASPLRSLDNITLIPHLAGSTPEAWSCAPGMVVDSMLSQAKA